MSGPRTVRAPRGSDLTCKNWLREAAYRMIQNNLDPEVAERPQDLVVYGGRGQAARDWDSFDAILESLQNLLESADYSVRLFSSARALLDSGYFREIDCLISDIHMPTMHGIELFRVVHESRPELPIIFVTGHPEMLNQSPPIDADHYRLFKKPFEGEELLAAVGEVLRKPRQRRPQPPAQ